MKGILGLVVVDPLERARNNFRRTAEQVFSYFPHAQLSIEVPSHRTEFIGDSSDRDEISNPDIRRNNQIKRDPSDDQWMLGIYPELGQYPGCRNIGSGHSRTSNTL